MTQPVDKERVIELINNRRPDPIIDEIIEYINNLLESAEYLPYSITCSDTVHRELFRYLMENPMLRKSIVQTYRKFGWTVDLYITEMPGDHTIRLEFN